MAIESSGHSRGSPRLYELIEHSPKEGDSPTIWEWPQLINWFKVAGQPVPGPWPPHQEPRPEPESESVPVAVSEPEPDDEEEEAAPRSRSQAQRAGSGGQRGAGAGPARGGQKRTQTPSARPQTRRDR